MLFSGPRIGSRALQWGLGLLVAIPATVLALLAMRSIRADRLEQQRLIREHHAQAAKLVDAAIESQLAGIQRSLPASGNPDPKPGVDPFSISSDGSVTFPEHGVVVGTIHREGHSDAVERVLEQAAAAEAQLRPDEASELYRQLIGIEPRLRTWSRLALLRMAGKDDFEAVRSIVVAGSGDGDRNEQVTPSGLPAELVAIASASMRTLPERARFAPLAERALTRLRKGSWTLTSDERRFYDELLYDLMPEAARARHSRADGALQKLQAIGDSLRDIALPARRPGAHSLRIGNEALLVIVSADASEGLGRGLAVGQPALSRFLASAARTAGLESAAIVGSGSTLWGAKPQGGWLSQPLQSVEGWSVVFPVPDTSALERKSRVWLAFVALMMATLLCAVIATIRMVRREAELVRIQHDFIAGVSHDFKSPLTAIRLLLERLSRRRAGHDDGSAYLAAAGRELDRLERHVNTLLEAQLVQAGRRQLAFAPAPLREVVDNAICALLPEAEAKKITVTHEAAPVAVSADETALTDAFVNVIGNAIRYSPAGSEVTIRSRPSDGRAVVEVSDEGIGIDADELERVFERFHRGRRSQAAGIGGSGLGLALVRATVEAHGGSVRASNRRGRGSVFIIELPAIDAAQILSGRGDAW